MGKYDALFNALDREPRDSCSYSFAELEALLGRPLPNSARIHAAWWGNHVGNSQAKAWLGAGFRVRAFLSDERARFTRVEGGAEKRAPGHEGGLQEPEPKGALERVLARLTRRRPVFHSEADLQHSLALVMSQSGFSELRLERPFRFERQVINLDLLARDRQGERVAIELKYWTKAAEFTFAEEDFKLKSQGAQPLSRYDFWRDVSRVETLVDEGLAERGWVIAITNEGGYWRPGSSASATTDVALRLHEGREVSGTLSWAEHTGQGTKEGRETPLSLRSSYLCRWRDYSDLGPELDPEDQSPGPFRALALEVWPTEAS